MRRREFIRKVFRFGGAVACTSLGFSPKEIAWAAVDTFEGQTGTDTWEGSGNVDTREGQAVASGASYTCAGYANTGCIPDSNPSSYSSSSSDRTYVRPWSATEGGTAYSIIWYRDSSWAPTAAWVVLYDNTTLIGYAEISGSESGWNETVLQAADGQSLSFSSSTSLLFGVAWDTTSICHFGRNDSGGPDLYYDSSSTDSGPLTTASWSTSSGRDMGSILKYVAN